MVTVTELGKYVTMLFQGSARGVLLTLSLPDERLTIYFAHHSGELMHAGVNFQEDAQRERLMRAFFVAQGLQLPSDDWTPITQFIPGVPVQSIYRISPLPPDATTASNLAAELFRQVCGLSDDDSLSFRYFEMGDPA